jgi:hypothetical protein
VQHQWAAKEGNNGNNGNNTGGHMESIWNPYGIHMADDGTSWNIMAMDGAIAQHSTTLNGDHGDKAKPAKLFFVPHDSLRN